MNLDSRWNDTPMSVISNLVGNLINIEIPIH